MFPGGKRGGMAKGKPINELKAWRKAAGLTMEAAGARIVVDGTPADKSTWHGWESGRKLPKYEAMLELRRVTGVEPGVFYDRPEGKGHGVFIVPDDAQPALL